MKKLLAGNEWNFLEVRDYFIIFNKFYRSVNYKVFVLWIDQRVSPNSSLLRKKIKYPNCLNRSFLLSLKIQFSRDHFFRFSIDSTLLKGEASSCGLCKVSTFRLLFFFLIGETKMGQQQSKGELLYQQVSYGNSQGIRTLHRDGADLEVLLNFCFIKFVWIARN